MNLFSVAGIIVTFVAAHLCIAG